MSRQKPFTKEEAKRLRKELGKKAYGVVYSRAYREANLEEINRSLAARRQKERMKKDNISLRHWMCRPLERPLKKDSYTCHDLAVMWSMDKLAKVVNKITSGELVLTFNTDETEKQKMVV